MQFRKHRKEKTKKKFKDYKFIFNRFSLVFKSANMDDVGTTALCIFVQVGYDGGGEGDGYGEGVEEYDGGRR